MIKYVEPQDRNIPILGYLNRIVISEYRSQVCPNSKLSTSNYFLMLSKTIYYVSLVFLSKQYIINCFRKSGISKESQEDVINEVDNPLKKML